MGKTLYERLKKARKNLNLSQEYVAKQMSVHRTTITAIELGNRKVASDELIKFSNLYGVSVNRLLYGEEQESEVKVLARALSKLSENDKNEIKNLIDFKKRYKESKNLNV